MIRAATAALALAIFVQPLPMAPAFASEPGADESRPHDPRLVQRLYDAGQVVRINGKARVQATIMFGEGERIENVAIGDSQSWQVTPNKRANLLFVKPLSASAKTNMTVVTNLRTYLFDLVASPRNKPLYVLSFTYPDEGKDEQLADGAAAGEANALEMAAVSDPYAVLDPAALNFFWEGEGNAQLLPLRTYDDGEATFLKWAAGAAVPAILVTDANGTEGPVNFTVRGDTVVVDGVPSQIILRAGDESAVLTYRGPGPDAAGEAATLAQANGNQAEMK